MPRAASACGSTCTRIAGFCWPADADESNSGNLRNLLQQNVLRIGVDRGQRQGVGRDTEHEDRGVRRVDLPDQRRIRDVGRQIGRRGIDRGQRVAHRSVDGAAQVELQGDLGVAERARRRHLGQPGNLAELLFERRGDGRRHGLRIGARQLRGHRQRRIVHVRQRARPATAGRRRCRPPAIPPSAVRSRSAAR